jgi:hypothetical protein
MYRRYGDRVAFFVVYVKEAHPDDGWVSQGNLDAGIHVYDPTSDEERTEVAQTCAVRLAIEMPMVVDEISNRVASAYGALPDRLYLVGKDGRIAYQGEKGPQGFRAEELEAAIEVELQRLGSSPLRS